MASPQVSRHLFGKSCESSGLNAHAEELHTYKFVRTHSQGDHNRGDACDIGSTVKGIAKEMPVLMKYAKQRIVALKGSGLKHGDVVYALRRENITTSKYLGLVCEGSLRLLCSSSLVVPGGGSGPTIC